MANLSRVPPSMSLAEIEKTAMLLTGELPCVKQNANCPQFFGILTKSEEEYLMKIYEEVLPIFNKLQHSSFLIDDHDDLEINPTSTPSSAPPYSHPAKNSRYFNLRKQILLVDANHDRLLFINNVFREIHGKELKMATNALISPVLENCIFLSFQSHSLQVANSVHDHIDTLIFDRFASHCLEALVYRTAILLNFDETGDNLLPPSPSISHPNDDSIESINSLELILLKFSSTLRSQALSSPHFATDPYACSVYRALLIALSGCAIPMNLVNSLIFSKSKKLPLIIRCLRIALTQSRFTSKDMRVAFTSLFSVIVQSLPDLTTLTLHPTASRLIQLLLYFESQHPALVSSKFTRSSRRPKKSKPPLLSQIISPLMNLSKGSSNEECVKSTSPWLESHLSHPVGSYFLQFLFETIPHDSLDQIFSLHLNHYILSLSFNDNASHLIASMLPRLSSANVEFVYSELSSKFLRLLRQSRFNVIRAIISAFHAHELSTQPILHNLIQLCQKINKSGILNLFGLLELLNPTFRDSELQSETVPRKRLRKSRPSSSQPYTETVDKVSTQNLLPRILEIMLEILSSSDELCDQLLGEIIDLPVDLVVALAQHPQLCVLAHSVYLTISPSRPYLNYISQRESIISSSKPRDVSSNIRRKFTSKLFGRWADLAQNEIGALLLKSLWTASQDLHYMRVRVVEELIPIRSKLKITKQSRDILQIWMVELFLTRRTEWNQIVKCNN